MKKFLTFTFLCFTGLANAQTTIPETIMFGQVAVLSALADANHFQVRAFSENVQIYDGQYGLAQLQSKEELKTAVKAVSIPLNVNDPRRAISLEVIVSDSHNQPLLQGYNSFNLFQKQGKWFAPDYAGYVFFSLMERKITVPGAKSAILMDKYGNAINLNVTNGVITIPSGYSELDWDTLFVKYQNGQSAKYDGTTGKRVRPASSVTGLNAWGIENLEDVEVISGVLHHNAQPQYGYNPVVEVNGSVKGTVTLDVGVIYYYDYTTGDGTSTTSVEYIAARPTKVMISTLNNIRAGIAPVEYEFSPQGYDQGTIDIAVPDGTYYLWFDWTPQMKNNNGSGPKG
jgi:hypothetical protein